MAELFWSEFLGTAVLVLLGNAVVASVVLKGSKGEGAGWLAICTGWAFALFVAIWVAAKSNAHLNPAVSIALATIDNFAWEKVPIYIVAQFLGAATGQVLVILHFWPHWKETLDGDAKRACFCTAPAIRAPPPTASAATRRAVRCLRCGEIARCDGVDIGPSPRAACGNSPAAGALRGQPFCTPNLEAISVFRNRLPRRRQ